MIKDLAIALVFLILGFTFGYYFGKNRREKDHE